MVRFVAAVLSLMLVHVASGSVNEEKNLVKNPGFEEVKDGKPEGWTPGGFPEGGKGTLDSSTDKPHGGKACAHIKGTGDWGTFCSTRIPVEKGKTYALKAYVRAGKGHALVKFDYFKGD